MIKRLTDIGQMDNFFINRSISVTNQVLDQKLFRRIRLSKNWIKISTYFAFFWVYSNKKVYKMHIYAIVFVLLLIVNLLNLCFIILWQDNEKKNILAVQTIRNTIMGSTLMATTSILLCSGLAAVISSTYSVKKPLNDTIYGAHGEFMVALKYVTLLVLFLFSFMCHSLSIRFISQVNFLINCPQDSTIVTSTYVSELLEKSFTLNAIGNRLFYSALPIVLWIFGPLVVILCTSTMVLVLYNLDFLFRDAKERTHEVANEV